MPNKTELRIFAALFVGLIRDAEVQSIKNRAAKTAVGKRSTLE
jgi:hypothetical protein